MSSRLCSNCKHLWVNTPPTGNQGQCRRHAPRALDVNGFSRAQAWPHHVSVGMLSATLVADAEVPLYLAEGPAAASVGIAPVAVSTDGLDDNTIFPVVVPHGYSLTTVRVRASRLNVGAGTKAAAITMAVHVCQIIGGSVATDTLVPVTIPVDDVGIFNAATDNFVDTDFVLPDSIYLSSGLIGVYIDTDVGAVNNKIREVRNVFVGLELNNFVFIRNPWPLVEDKTTYWCGEFEPALSV